MLCSLSGWIRDTSDLAHSEVLRRGRECWVVGTEVLLLLCVNCPSSLENSKSLQGGIPAGAIRGGDITPRADTEITSHAVGAFTAFTGSWMLLHSSAPIQKGKDLG